MKSELLVLIGVIIIEVVSEPLHDGSEVDCIKCHPIYQNKINVHLIPHSHDDEGWLKTVDQYYYGMNSSIQQAGVQYIITSVFEALLDNSDRRFIQVETEFFWKWWQHQTSDTKSKYKQLVDNGQIEMVNGAWSMNDEACSNYQSTIDQFTWGLRILNETLGKCGKPRVGWQIDPFGHSREQASLLSQMGYDGVFFARLDHDDKDQRKEKAALDFAWQGSVNLDKSTIFGSTFATSLYFPPDGFCWDYRCTDDSIVDNPKSSDYNIKEKIANFTKIINEYKSYFPTNNIIIPMGGDFQYEAAEKNYLNMDKFINGFKGNQQFNVIYSTPSCYIKAVNKALKKKLVLKKDDFFPYSDKLHSFWTGYYTSRPNSKRFERIGHNILQATKQLYSQDMYFTNKSHDLALNFLRETMGIMQHHDAITGTEKQHVTTDYVRRLLRGIELAEQDLGNVVNNLLGSHLKLNFSSCLLTNSSICEISRTSSSFIIALYNPLAWEVTHYVRLPVDEGEYEINGKNGEPYDLIPVINNFTNGKLSIGSPSTHELVFAAKKILPLGLKLYHIKKISSKKSAEETPITDSFSAFSIDENTNLLKSVYLNGLNLEISQNFYHYYSHTGVNDQSNIASGAYIFRPTEVEPESMEKVEIINKISGKVVDEVHQKWMTDKAEILQIIRWYKNENYVELDWTIGNINIEDGNGKEFISKFTVTDPFDNKNIFYTDSNGRELMTRTKNKRPDYKYDPKKEPVAGNYYPVTSRIVIKDMSKNIAVAVLTDRSQGGSSLEKNEIELMVHRRILHDDYKGVDENLNETEFGKGVYVRGSHYLVIGKANGSNKNDISTASQERILAQKKLLQPWMGLSSTMISYENLLNATNVTYEGLTNSLPDNVNILTFEPWYNKSYLLRLEHIMEKTDDTDLSKPVSVNIINAFKHFDVDKIEELTLGANQLLSDYEDRPKYVWKIENSSMAQHEYRKTINNFGLINLKPMEIRTFKITLKEKDNNHPSSFGINIQPVTYLIHILVIILLMQHDF